MGYPKRIVYMRKSYYNENFEGFPSLGNHHMYIYIDPLSRCKGCESTVSALTSTSPQIKTLQLLMKKVTAFDSWVALSESNGWPSQPVVTSSTSWPFSRLEMQDPQMQLRPYV